MKSSFRNRLFRLFLLFSLIPSLLVALIGYFMASERGILTQPSESSGLFDVASYYNTFLTDQIQKSLGEWSTRPDSETSLDFVIRLNDSGRADLVSPALKDSAILNRIVGAAKSKPSGFVESNGEFYQYALVHSTGGGDLIGGFVHDSTYGLLTQTVQEEMSRSTSARVLGSSYILFVGVVFVVFAIVAVLLAYYFSLRYSRSLAAPLLELSEASQRIAQGDFDQQVVSHGVGEINELIRNFNMMARQLQHTTARLAQSERVAAWRQVARRFAHELKNPLQPIMISLYRIEKRLKESGQYEQLTEPLKAASEELKHLTELAERFSRLAKLPEPSLESVNLNDLLSSIGQLYSEQLSSYDFRIELPQTPISASVDPVYFREALHNLLQNAADASSSGSVITLRLFETEAGPAIQVQDVGHGMTKDVVSSAAIPYFTTKSKGTGLGLAVVEKTVNELNGQLQIDSAEGVGTTVTIVLPETGENETKNSHS